MEYEAEERRRICKTALQPRTSMLHDNMAHLFLALAQMQ
jgi:hypothetical protein